MKLPIITSSPHDGDSFEDFSHRVILSEWNTGEFSDKYTADTAYHPNALGNLKSHVSRGLGSLNQPRDYSLFRLKDFHGNTIWKRDKYLILHEKEKLFQKYYDPYYNEIEYLINKNSKNFMKIILWDHHDTGDFDLKTGKRNRKLPGEKRSMPKFILSNFGLANTGKVDSKNGFITSPVKFMQSIRTLIAIEFGLKKHEVEINTSYKGGNIIQHFGKPNKYMSEIYAIQIEYNRGLIMNQVTREPYLDKIEKYNKKFNKVMEKAVNIL